MSEKVEETIVEEEVQQEEQKETRKEKKAKKKSNDCQQELGEMVQKYQRLLADMENLRKRTDEEKADNYKYRASGFIIEVLPTIDMFEQALNAKNVSDEVKN
jgi:molecular chaperone GrpE